MARQTSATPKKYESLMQCAIAEQAISAALAKFHNCVCLHNIPFWGPFSVVRLQDLPQGGLHDVPIAPRGISCLQSFSPHSPPVCSLRPDLFSTQILGPGYDFFFYPQVKTSPPALCSCPPPPPWLGRDLVAGKANSATQATLSPLIFVLKKGPSGKAQVKEL
jgi:hypothetical protein